MRWQPVRPKSTLRFDSLLKMADNLLRSTGASSSRWRRRHNKTVTLMPKPIFPGQRLRHARPPESMEGGKNLFFGRGTYADLSPMALHYIGGILKHAPALLAFCAPTTNSYHAGSFPDTGADQPDLSRSAIAARRFVSRSIRRARRQSASKCASRIPTANGYLAFSALLMAGLDGIQEQDYAARTARQGSSRSAAGGSREGGRDAAAACGSA